MARRREKKPRSKFWKWARRVYLVILVLSLCYAGLFYYRMKATPAHWYVVDVSDPEIAPRAERFEYWVQSQVMKLRGHDEPWQIELKLEDINHWLGTRLHAWAANQGRDLSNLSHPLMVIEEDRVIVAAEVQSEAGAMVASAAYEPVEHEIDPVVAELSTIWLGKQRVTMGVETLVPLAAGVGHNLGLLDENQMGQLDKLIHAIERIELRYKIDSGRQLRVDRVELFEDRMVLHCRTTVMGM